MNISEISIAVDKINSIIRRNLWCDFEVNHYSKYRLTLYGGIDLLYSHDFELSFEDVFFVSLPIEWKTDTKKITLELLEGEEAKNVNSRFKVEQGYYIFKFTPEDYPNDFWCLIGAKSVAYIDLKDN